MFLRKRTQRHPEPYTAHEVRSWMRRELIYCPQDYRDGHTFSAKLLVRRAVLAGLVSDDALTHYQHPGWDLAEAEIAYQHRLRAIHTPRYADAVWRNR